MYTLLAGPSAPPPSFNSSLDHGDARRIFAVEAKARHCWHYAVKINKKYVKCLFSTKNCSIKLHDYICDLISLNSKGAANVNFP